MGFFRVDPMPRIEFYVRQGLVSRLPTPAQLALAAKRNSMNAGAVERIVYYARHPRQILPGGKPALQTNEEVYAEGSVNKERTETSYGHGLPWLDRKLVTAMNFSPLRFAVQTVFNPWNVVPTPGLEIPGRFLIAHLLHTPHPTALWDVQVLHPDPGGLDELERQIEIVAAGRGPRARLFRAMAPRPGYYDYLARLVQRVRRFDYPESPANLNATFDNLVLYLNRAAGL